VSTERVDAAHGTKAARKRDWFSRRAGAHGHPYDRFHWRFAAFRRDMPSHAATFTDGNVQTLLSANVSRSENAISLAGLVRHWIARKSRTGQVNNIRLSEIGQCQYRRQSTAREYGMKIGTLMGSRQQTRIGTLYIVVQKLEGKLHREKIKSRVILCFSHFLR
jgi:hypothetical protein